MFKSVHKTLYSVWNKPVYEFKNWYIQYTIFVDLVPQPSSECEAKVDLVFIQTSFALLWKLSLKNTS